KLLELTNVSEWDGRILKEREQKIRDSALILAGQCIALLLYNLSQSQDALDTAITQTQGWWHPKTHRHGFRKRQILTAGNVLVTLNLQYLVTRSEKNDKNQSESQGFFP
ncbi:MAG: ISLre2-like element ISCst1 family transposase, partial [Nostoc sp.]